MTKQELRDLIASAAENGTVQVREIPEGKRAIDPAIAYCRCGCRGNWTDHTMRLGENGMRHNWSN